MPPPIFLAFISYWLNVMFAYTMMMFWDWCARLAYRFSEKCHSWYYKFEDKKHYWNIRYFKRETYE